MSEKLKACPFDGAPAVLDFNRYHGTGASGMETPEPYVRCSTPGCVRMAPIPCDDWPYGRTVGALTSKQARAKAVKLWNNRV